MLQDGQNVGMDMNLANDIIAYMGGSEAFNAYVDGNYDSSGDYWRVITDENGKVTQVLDDGDKDTITVVDKNGKIISVTQNDCTSLTQQIDTIVNNYEQKNVLT